MSFETLGLSQPVLRALAQKNYSQATPIQMQAIPTLLKGRDLLGIAQTGTGKTAAFMLPSIDRLTAATRIPRPRACRMLVLAPTRELASQIAESASAYSRFARLSVTTAFGGVPIGKQKRALERGVDVLVATPGRLIDLVEQGYLSLREVEILVLDEADQMLDLGFIHALRQIVKWLPQQRQTLFFSATMPKAIKELADKYLTNPAEVAVTPVARTADRVDQKVVLVNQQEKTALLTIFLQSEQVERALVFSRTKHGADKIVRMLGAAVHLELAAQLLPRQRGLGQHAEHRLLDHPVGMLLQEIASRRVPLVAHVAGVGEVRLVLLLAAGETHLGGVHHHDEVTAIHVRRVGRLVLAADELGHDTDQPAERHTGGIHDVPTVGDVVGRGGVGLHERCRPGR